MVFTRRIKLKTITGNDDRKKRRICYCHEFLYWTVADCVQQMLKIKFTPLRSDATLTTGAFQTWAASNLFLLIYSHSQSCVWSMSCTVDKQDLESGLRNTLRCHRRVLWDLRLIYARPTHLRDNCTFLPKWSQLRCCFLPQCSGLLSGGSVSSTLLMHLFQVLALNSSFSIFVPSSFSLDRTGRWCFHLVSLRVCVIGVDHLCIVKAKPRLFLWMYMSQTFV